MNTQIKTNSAPSGVRDLKGLSTTGMGQTPHAPNAPEKKFRAGAITATVWANKIQNNSGEEAEYQTISLERNYTDKEGKWHSTNSMRVNDLPKALIVLQKAYEYSVLQEQ